MEVSCFVAPELRGGVAISRGRSRNLAAPRLDPSLSPDVRPNPAIRRGDPSGVLQPDRLTMRRRARRFFPILSPLHKFRVGHEALAYGDAFERGQPVPIIMLARVHLRSRAAPRRELLPLRGQRSGGGRKRGGTHFATLPHFGDDGGERLRPLLPAERALLVQR